MHQLLVPEPLAGAGVQRDERIAEQVVARTIAAEEVVARAAKRDEDDAVLLVDGHLAPVVHAAGRAVSVFGPGAVTELAGVRDAVEHPAKLARHDVVPLNGAW